MEKVFHVRCPNIDGEMRITKICTVLGNYMHKNDIIAMAENKDFILELRTTVTGVLSKLHISPGSVIFTGEMIADINTTENFKEEDNAPPKNEINMADIKDSLQIRDSEYPALSEALEHYLEPNKTPQNEPSMISCDPLEEILDELDSNDKKGVFSAILKFFNRKHNSNISDFSSVEEVDLMNILKSFRLFKENFSQKYKQKPMIEPFVIKSLNAALYDDFRYVKNELNFILIDQEGKVSKSHLKDISKKNFFELQTDIKKNNGLKDDSNILTLVSNQKSTAAFSQRKNTIIFNKISEQRNRALLTFNMQEISNSSLMNNFLIYLENPGWIFFLL